MREILFRGKRVDNGEWIDGYYLKAAGMSFISSFAEREPIYVDNETIGQYTGLTDKNGKKIFEGDLVRVFNLYATLVGVIEYKDCYIIRDIKDSFCIHIPPKNSDIEVIGNIYDNPELLEVE